MKNEVETRRQGVPRRSLGTSDKCIAGFALTETLDEFRYEMIWKVLGSGSRQDFRCIAETATVACGE